MIQENEEIKNVALYTRVSTDEQANEGFSMDSQLKRLRLHCEAREWTIVGEYIDAGFSGRNTRRPGYQKMMADMDKWDALVIIKMDRIHRNQTNFTSMMVDLRNHDKQFVSMSESYDTSNAMGRFIMDFIQRLAQLESEIIGERVTWGMDQKLKDPSEGWVGNRPPLGYKRKKIIKDGLETKIFLPVPKDIELVKSIFQMYDDGFSIGKISKKTGKPGGCLAHILHNPFYAGFFRFMDSYKKLKTVDPIISIKLYNGIQRKMASKSCKKKCDIFQLPEDKEFFSMKSKDQKKICHALKPVKKAIM